jgi:ketosteroid isomerase-like protein
VPRQASSEVSTQAIEREIRSLEEDQCYRAMLEADTRATCLEGVQATGLTYRKIDWLQDQLQVHGDTAVVTGRARIDLVVDGLPTLACLRYVSVWVKRPTGWQTVAFQSTPIPPA